MGDSYAVDGLPLAARREPRAAASAQSGREHRRDRLVRCAGPGVAQAAPATHRDVRIEIRNRLGVQDTRQCRLVGHRRASYPGAASRRNDYDGSTTGGPSRRSRTRDATTATVNSTTMTPSEIAVGMCHQCDTAILAPTKISTSPSPWPR